MQKQKNSHWRHSLLAFLLTSAAAAEELTTTIDLAAAKNYAITHNYGIAALRFERDQIKSKETRAAAAFFPKIGMAAGIETKNAGASSEAAPLAYLYGSYNLFNGFRDSYRQDIARSESEKSEFKLKSLEFIVGLEVEEFFHAYLFKKDLIDIKNNEIELNAAHQRLVQQTRLRGAIAETDVMEFQLKEALLKSELVALRQELEDARSNLKRLLGEEIGSTIQPVGKLQHQHIKNSLAEALAKVHAATQSVKTKAFDLSIATIESKIAGARWLPELSLEGRAGALNFDEGSKETNPQTSIMLVAKMELYSGGDASGETQEKNANALKCEAQLKDEINTAIRKVEMGYRNLKVIETRADLEKDNELFSRRYYHSVLDEYKRGFKNSSDLSNAAEKLSQAHARKLALEFDFIRERVAVEKNLGSVLEIEIISEKQH